MLTIYRPYTNGASPHAELCRLAALAGRCEAARAHRRGLKGEVPRSVVRAQARWDARRAAGMLAHALLRHQSMFAHEGRVYSADEWGHLVRRRAGRHRSGERGAGSGERRGSGAGPVSSGLPTPRSPLPTLQWRADEPEPKGA